jgi:hypothetical protein
MFKKIPYGITGIELGEHAQLHHINKMGQIRFQLEINQNSKTKLNFLAELK